MDHELDLHLDGPGLTAALTDIASVSGEEGPLADAIERELRRLPQLTVTRHGNTLVARTALGRKERVVLAGHLDTVPHAANFPSFFDVERSRLTGVGTSDMKAGVAVQLRLAATLDAPSRDVTYVFYECEEVAAERNGLFLLSRNAPELLDGQFAVLLEPSGGVVEGGCQGTLRADVTAAGERAHSARAWIGTNAIHEAAGILEILRDWVPRRPDVDGLEYHEGLNAVAISGGVAGNVVPDECVVTVNYRFAPDRTAAEAEDVHPRPVLPLAGGDPGRRPGRAPRPPRPARGRVGGRGRRQPPRQAGLDRRGQVRRAGHPRRQLRPRHLRDRPHAGRVRRNGPDRRGRRPPPRLAHRLARKCGYGVSVGDDGNAIRGLRLSGRYLAHSVRVTVVLCLAPFWST